MEYLTMISIGVLGLISAAAVYMWHGWKAEAMKQHQYKMEMMETSLALLNAVQVAAQKMDLAEHKDAAAILVTELVQVRGLIIKRREA